MRTCFSFFLAALLTSLTLVACDGDTAGDAGTSATDAGVGDAGDTDGGSTDAGAPESCEATFVWWQKDAYREAAGRGSDFWPPHTTTSLEVVCTPVDSTPEVVSFREQVNHGTSVEDEDPMGTQILDAVRTETVSGTRAQLTELAAAYDACECGTTFLSLDALSDTAVMDLVTELATYLNTNMSCPDSEGGVAQLISDLMAGDIDAVLALGPMCTFAAGSWEQGLNDALAAVVAATSEVLADYHVCNNDALLHAALWDEFVSAGTVSACDAASPVCSSPVWFLPCSDTERAGCLPTP